MVVRRLCTIAIILLCGMAHGVNVEVHSTAIVPTYARWEFVGDYFRRDIPAAKLMPSLATYLPTFLNIANITSTTAVNWAGIYSSLGWMGVNDWRLHKGWSDVHATGAKVGQVWGYNPETGLPLVYTADMINSYGNCYGYAPDIYSAPLGQAVYNHFQLDMVPVKNPEKGNAWWPKLRMRRLDADMFQKIISTLASFSKQ